MWRRRRRRWHRRLRRRRRRRRRHRRLCRRRRRRRWRRRWHRRRLDRKGHEQRPLHCRQDNIGNKTITKAVPRNSAKAFVKNQPVTKAVPRNCYCTVNCFCYCLVTLPRGGTPLVTLCNWGITPHSLASIGASCQQRCAGRSPTYCRPATLRTQHQAGLQALAYSALQTPHL